ncbi:MAG TPA: hypothetical protein VIH78_11250 [Terriglobales bacterium]
MSDTDLRQRISEDEKSEDESTGSSSASPTALAPEELLRTAADATLTEDLALSLLKRADLHPEVLERLAKNASALKSRKLRIALASHPRTPRHVSVPLARQLYTFDLMKVALSPSAPADVKVAVDDILIARLETVTLGERLTLARRASGRVAAALLLLDVENGKAVEGSEAKIVELKVMKGKTPGPQVRIMQAALDNPRLTEALVISSVLRADASVALVHAVARHARWSPRKEIGAALLRTEHLSLARALAFARTISPLTLGEILRSSRLPEKIKDQILRECLGGDALGENLCD